MTLREESKKTHCPHGVWMNNGGPYQCRKCAIPKLRIKFVKQDIWVGLFWNTKDIYVCLIPCFPIIWRRD